MLNVLLWLEDQSDQVWFALDALEVVSPDTSVLELVVDCVADQSDHVVLLAEEVVVETMLVLGVGAEVVVIGVLLPRSGVVES